MLVVEVAQVEFVEWADVDRSAQNDSTSLKLSHSQQLSEGSSSSTFCLDDKSADACIISVNPVKPWTFAYARDVVKSVTPRHNLPIMIVANFRDVREKWVVPLAVRINLCAVFLIDLYSLE